MNYKKEDKGKSKTKLDDKFIPGTIESQYDNYFSSEEEVDEKEMERDYEL